MPQHTWNNDRQHERDTHTHDRRDVFSLPFPCCVCRVVVCSRFGLGFLGFLLLLKSRRCFVLCLGSCISFRTVCVCFSVLFCFLLLFHPSSFSRSPFLRIQACISCGLVPILFLLVPF